jgi:hypothetical protein
MSAKSYDMDQSAAGIPELQALRLVTIYGDESTTLVSLAHKVIIADFDGRQPQYGIPHLDLDQSLEREMGQAYWAEDWKGDEEGFPGWPAVFAYIQAHPEVLARE